MLVGLQRRGKTTLLSRLTELNEIEQVATTYNSRNSGETLGGLNARSSRNATGVYICAVKILYTKDFAGIFSCADILCMCNRCNCSFTTCRGAIVHCWGRLGHLEVS